ncbi:hypothetical protein [Alicyclobacillus kakegawensis]|uniref:hypothetical protein n=1 Tax=Alicyclobacillus kakegawensis TaxID=392012 RepID=UPI0012EEA80C|nr:hypothetical protein [Alicyclobacillus kakegawensis]
MHQHVLTFFLEIVLAARRPNHGGNKKRLPSAAVNRQGRKAFAFRGATLLEPPCLLTYVLKDPIQARRDSPRCA